MDDGRCILIQCQGILARKSQEARRSRDGLCSRAVPFIPVSLIR